MSRTIVGFAAALVAPGDMLSAVLSVAVVVAGICIMRLRREKG